MLRKELLLILPLVVAVTVSQSNRGYEYYGTSNVRVQRPQPIYGERPLILPERPVTGPAAPVETTAPAANEPAARPAPPPAVPSNSPARRPLYQPSYRPLLPPRPIRPLVVTPTPQPPVTEGAAPEIVTPQEETAAPVVVEPIPTPAPEPIRPHHPQSPPIAEPIPQPEPKPQPEPVLQPKPILQPEATPQPEPEPTRKPEPIPLPEAIPKPEPIPQPEPTRKPELIPPPEPIRKPEPTSPPEPIRNPEPISSPEPTQKPEPISPPEPTRKPELIPPPEPTQKPKPIPPPKPVLQPEPNPQPEPVLGNELVEDPGVLEEREPVPSPKPQPKPEPVPVSSSILGTTRYAHLPVTIKPVALPPLLPKPEPNRRPDFGRHSQPTPADYYPITVTYPTPTRTVATQTAPVVYPTEPHRPVTEEPEHFIIDFQCKESYGYYPVAHECDTYIECKQNRAKKYSCPDGLHFNPAAKYYEYPCAYPSEVKCMADASEQNPKPTGKCPNQYGFYPMNDGDCSKFIMCQEGLSTIMDCPMGLVFNPQTSTCDWPANVPQCNPNVFKDFTCPDPPRDEYGQLSDIIYKYRYGQQCKLYIACQLGHPRLLSCDRGLSFDDASQSCIDEDYVSDCAVPYLH